MVPLLLRGGTGLCLGPDSAPRSAPRSFLAAMLPRLSSGGAARCDEVGELVEVGRRVDPPALLDVVDELGDLVEDRAGDVAEHLVDLGLALTHREVAVDAAVRLGAAPGEL